MSYLLLAMVTLIWKQTVAFLLSVKWRESISITGYRCHLLFRSVYSMHSEPFKIKAWSFFGTFFSPVRVWRPIQNGSATHQLGTTDLEYSIDHSILFTCVHFHRSFSPGGQSKKSSSSTSPEPSSSSSSNGSFSSEEEEVKKSEEEKYKKKRKKTKKPVKTLQPHSRSRSK